MNTVLFACIALVLVAACEARPNAGAGGPTVNNIKAAGSSATALAAGKDARTLSGTENKADGSTRGGAAASAAQGVAASVSKSTGISQTTWS